MPRILPIHKFPSKRRKKKRCPCKTVRTPIPQIKCPEGFIKAKNKRNIINREDHIRRWEGGGDPKR